MEITYECPFGSKCEEIKDNRLFRCRFYTLVRGKNPQSEEMLEEWNCSLAWLPMLLIENSQTSRGVAKALESFRNEVVRNQQEFNVVLFNEISKRKALETIEDKVALIVSKEKQKMLDDKQVIEVIEHKEE